MRANKVKCTQNSSKSLGYSTKILKEVNRGFPALNAQNSRNGREDDGKKGYTARVGIVERVKARQRIKNI